MVDIFVIYLDIVFCIQNAKHNKGLPYENGSYGKSWNQL